MDPFIRIDVSEIAVPSCDAAMQLVVCFEAGRHRRFGVAGSTVRLPLDADGDSHSLHVAAGIGTPSQTYVCLESAFASTCVIRNCIGTPSQTYVCLESAFASTCVIRNYAAVQYVTLAPQHFLWAIC
jgi:hypothetical protein